MAPHQLVRNREGSQKYIIPGYQEEIYHLRVVFASEGKSRADCACRDLQSTLAGGNAANRDMTPFISSPLASH